MAELAKVLTPENGREVLPRLFHASKREAKEVAAELRPAEVAPRREFVTAVRPAAARPAPEPAAPTSARAVALDLAQPVHPENQPERVSSPPPDEVVPLDAEHIPAAVKRAVWTRDGGRCQWPVASGGVCGSTTRLELDHVLPVALGGEATVENLRIVCQVHNLLAARETFGGAWMERFASRKPPRDVAQTCAEDGAGRGRRDTPGRKGC